MVAQVRTVDQQRGPLPDIPVGSTPVHAAAFRGDLAIVQAMLQVPKRNCVAKSAVLDLLVANLRRIGARPDITLRCRLRPAAARTCGQSTVPVRLACMIQQTRLQAASGDDKSF